MPAPTSKAKGGGGDKYVYVQQGDNRDVAALSARAQIRFSLYSECCPPTAMLLCPYFREMMLLAGPNTPSLNHENIHTWVTAEYNEMRGRILGQQKARLKANAEGGGVEALSDVE